MMTPNPDEQLAELAQIARRVRGKVVEMSNRGRAPHLGSALSCVDILVAAYWGVLRIDPRNPRAACRDRLILSKGHASSALYAVLAERGFFPTAWLDRYAQPGSPLTEHMGPGCVPGVEAATGSLGHGLSLGAGMALAGRIQQRDDRIWVVLSDGECNEGSVWEAAMFAPAQQLDNLIAVVDFNRWQATGRSDEILALEPLGDKWSSFGWQVSEVDGHDLAALLRAMRQCPAGTGRPACIIAHTIKGRGVSFMEDDNNWHYRIPTDDEVRAAREELGLR
jgi:transketolase